MGGGGGGGDAREEDGRLWGKTFPRGFLDGHRRHAPPCRLAVDRPGCGGGGGSTAASSAAVEAPTAGWAGGASRDPPAAKVATRDDADRDLVLSDIEVAPVQGRERRGPESVRRPVGAMTQASRAGEAAKAVARQAGHGRGTRARAPT